MSGTTIKRSAASLEHQSGKGLRALMRRALRFARPLFAPLLNRLQFRMQSAVEQSSVLPRLQTIEAKTLDIESGVQRGHAETQNIKTSLQEFEAKLAHTSAQLAGIETALRHLGMNLVNSDQQRSKQIEMQTAELMAGLDTSHISGELQSQTAELSARLDVLQVSCDVVRLNQIEFGKLDRQGVT